VAVAVLAPDDEAAPRAAAAAPIDAAAKASAPVPVPVPMPRDEVAAQAGAAPEDAGAAQETTAAPAPDRPTDATEAPEPEKPTERVTVAQAEENAKPRPAGGPAKRAPPRAAGPAGSPPARHPEAARPADAGPAAGSATSGVTIINTAELAQKMTGLKTITAVPESSGGSFDPIRTLAQAESMARKLMPDAVLVGIDIDHAKPDGTALLRADSGATYRFRSPSRSKRPADVPRNVEVDIPCMVHVEVVRGRIAASPVTDEECDAARLPRPRCRVADLWRRAREQGAPRAGDWVARISYMHDGWFVDIPKAGTPPLDDFDVSLTDDCR
jgi:hypothetical protein